MGFNPEDVADLRIEHYDEIAEHTRRHIDPSRVRRVETAQDLAGANRANFDAAGRIALGMEALQEDASGLETSLTESGSTNEIVELVCEPIEVPSGGTHDSMDKKLGPKATGPQDLET